MTQVYYPSLGKLHIEQIRTDSLLNPLTTSHFACPYNIKEESLYQILPVKNDYLLLLKRSKNETYNNVLELMKCDMLSGRIEATQFTVGNNLFSQPAMRYNDFDSTILVYSMVRESIMTSGIRRLAFMCKMDYSLQPVVPATLLVSPDLCTFFAISDQKLNWLHFLDARLSFLASKTFRPWDYWQHDLANYDMEYFQNTRKQQIWIDNYQSNHQYTGNIRFSIVNDQLRVVSDSSLLIENKGFNIRPTNYGKFRLKEKSCLIMEQQLPDKSTGLLLVKGSVDKRVEMEDLTVYNRYKYFLPQLQQTPDGSIIIPYGSKKELGLMMLKLD